MSQPGEGEKSITLGSKGTPLTAAAVFAIASASAQVRIDSSALDRLASSEIINIGSNSYTLESLIPEIENSVDHRATFVLLLSNLLRFSSVRSSLLTNIADALNSRNLASLNCVNLTKEEYDIAANCGAEFSAICAIVEHSSTALGAVVSAITALSCEALKGNMGSVFELSDKGDGLAHKERLGVASDFKVLLNGSKLVGKSKDALFSQIPTVIGYFKEAAKIVHSKARVELNSFNEGDRETAAKSISLAVEPLVFPLKELGGNSMTRLKMNLSAIVDAACKSELLTLFEKNTSEIDSFEAKSKTVCLSFIERDYEKFLFALRDFLGTVRKIVTWEGIFALFAIENGELLGAKVEVDKEANGKAEKKKKKKAVLGKGTNQIVNWINERVLNSAEQNDLSSRTKNTVGLLEMFFDPKSPVLPEFIAQLKEFVESNESRRLPKLPKGTRDFSKEQMAIRERAFAIITQVFKRHGATALDTPAFELRETLTGKYGEDSKLIYDLADQGGELCSLRYDLTVPFARHVAFNGLTNFKRYQIAKVYRRDNPSKGRYREFYQCDLDIAGNYTKMGPDFEIIKILTELLDELNIGNYEVKLNHRKLLDGMLEICGVPKEKFRSVCSSIDKLDKQPFDQVKREMVEEKGISEEVAEKIGAFVKEKGSPKELLAKLKQQGSEFMQNGSSKTAIEELEILFEALNESRCIDRVVFDLSLARGLDYYTGVIFESVFKGSTEVGSIAAGGRYDDLIGMFGAKQVPAVGVSLGIERVFAIMEKIHKDQNESVRATETEVLLSVLGNESKLGLCARMVGELWDAKVKAEYEISTRFSKHMDRAKDGKIRWMVLVGDKEVEKGVFKLKNLDSSLEEELPLDNFVHLVKSRLSK